MVGVTVRGGVGGIVARYEDMQLTATVFSRAARSCGADALDLAGYVGHPVLVGSALADPVGGAEAEAALIVAASDAAGLAACCTGIDLALRAAAVAYAGADRLESVGREDVWPILLLPAALGETIVSVATDGPVAGLQRFLTADPGLTDELVDALPGGSGAVTGLLAPLYPDGAPHVRSAATIAMGPAPRSLADIVDGLALRNAGVPGEIDVRILARAHGPRHVIVDIPGTKDWSPALHQQDITSLATNLRALDGVPTSYEAGVIVAMRRAGVRSDDDVLLVGHSEGGMVALNTAAHASGFRISHVITAGAPVGRTSDALPAAVQVLALENRADVVPHLDGRVNADRPNVVTVSFTADHANILANHDITASYRPGAAAVDASTDPSVRRYLSGLRGFLSGGQASTQAFVIARTYR